MEEKKVSKEMTIQENYSLQETIAAELFEGLTYPWEALPNIGAFIKKLGPTVAASFCKLMLLDMIFLPIAIKFGFRGQELIALLIMLGSPTTPASYVMSKNMGHDGTLSASCVAATTLFSAVTMTLWIYVLSAGGFLA